MVGGRHPPATGTATRMLRAMWVFPLVAAVVAFVFAGLLGRQFVSRRHGYQLVWAIALVMYASRVAGRGRRRR